MILQLYFLCKYTMLFSIIGMLIALNTTTKVDCQALYTYNQFFGSAAIGTASTLLMLRTVAIWNKNWFVTIPLVIVGIGHWSILMYSVTAVRAVFLPEAKTCVVVSTGDDHHNLTLNLLYLYSACSATLRSLCSPILSHVRRPCRVDCFHHRSAPYPRPLLALEALGECLHDGRFKRLTLHSSKMASFSSWLPSFATPSLPLCSYSPSPPP